MIAPPIKPDVPILQNMETEKYLNAKTVYNHYKGIY